MEIIKAQKFLLVDDGVVFVFEGEREFFPELDGEQPLVADFIDGIFCLVCGPYCMPLTDEIVSHLTAFTEGKRGKRFLILGTRTGFMEYQIEPLFDFALGWTALTKLMGLYEMVKAKEEEQASEETSCH